MNPLLLTDYYKTEHIFQYPKGTTMVYSNMTPRKSRLPGVDKMVFFGLQYFIKKYLIEEFQREFFDRPVDEVIEEYSFAVHGDSSHISALHKLGYLPIEIKAVPEGTRVPMRVPCLTIKNTLPEKFWLTNYLETLMSAMLWQPCTSATIAYEYKKLFDKALLDTVGDNLFSQWMGHDFSARGMSSVESMILSGMGHLTSFTGTDTVPAIYALRRYYNATGLIGGSVPATEHSVMCAGTGVEGELRTFERLISEIYPSGPLSIVSDTFDLWDVLVNFMPQLKDKIMARDGRIVLRPDSGDPVDIICGNATVSNLGNRPEDKGVIELLWDTFGGTVINGYKVLDPHVGAIYGDSITIDRANQIIERLKLKGFAPVMVFGIGSYTYQYNTRDTFGIAMKATYIEVNGVGINIFKDPVTDDGTKKSAKGLLRVNNDLSLMDCCSWEEEGKGLLTPVFRNGVLLRDDNLAAIRLRLS